MAENASRAAMVLPHYNAEIVERCLAAVTATSRDPGRAELRADDVAAHQLVWARYVVTGAPRFGEAVLLSLSALCDSRLRAREGGSGAYSCARLGDDARLLELLTWIWRVERRGELRSCAEAMVDRALTGLRVPGLGFAASAGASERTRACPADANGLMVVALIEAGSVFERRDWLVLARAVFDEIATVLSDAIGDDRARPPSCRLDDRACMSRAAIRLFEAFGKQRTLDLAVSWTTDSVMTVDVSGVAERRPSLGISLMIGVLARLHALTGEARYAEQAETLVEAHEPAIAGAGIAGATAVENARTFARLLSIRVSGDPRRGDTRELMRVALDCGLPDRLVLGPGAGGEQGESPLARIAVGPHRLAPIDDAARLRALLAPGGLADVFGSLDQREAVDSRRKRGVT